MHLFPFADIDAQYARDQKLKREDVAKLDEWQRMQTHFPPPLHPIETALFLHSCYYSTEAAKKCIDWYYTCRRYCPEFLTDMDPLSPELQLGLDTCTITTLPDLTPEGYMLFYGVLNDSNPQHFHSNTALKIAEMVTTLALRQRGCHMGHVLIFDFKGLKWGHVLKANMFVMRKAAIYLQNGLPLRLKSFHYVNVNEVSFLDKILMLVKPLLKKEIQDALHIHVGDNSTIFKFVPRDILPIECGGSKLSAIDYFKNVTRKDIERHSEFFKQEESRVMDESKRPRQSKTYSENFGMDGTFKNLDID